MDLQSENDHLRALVSQYERDTRRTKWLLKRLSDKIRHFPRDLSRRLRASRRKKRQLASGISIASSLRAIAEGPAVGRSDESKAGTPFKNLPTPKEAAPLFQILEGRRDELIALRKSDPASEAMLRQMEDFSHSPLMQDLIAKAAAIAPEIGRLSVDTPSFCAPWHDPEYEALKLARRLLPKGPFETVILVPHSKMGGADLVAGILARAVSDEQRTLIIRTDAPDWDRPDWYPESARNVDLSGVFKSTSDRGRTLYALLNEIAPRRIYNVNSRLAFDTFVDYGERLACRFDLYEYFFCADRTPDGIEVGYPVWYFAPTFPHLKAALIDTDDLANTLIERFTLPPLLAAKVFSLHTPALTPVSDVSVAERQVESRGNRERPHVLWAGRLDRQKRFDLVAAIAGAMPDVDFSCWGKAVLDAPPDLSGLPRNLKINEPFASYSELPFEAADGWLYTSAWDGLPTILIELGALGVPIVASAVGGVPELIDKDTGWPVPGDGETEDYVRALREMIDNPKSRVARAGALQERVRINHTMSAYKARLAQA
jgi:glycosyltransferase involved in cell wall biosynthesis